LLNYTGVSGIGYQELTELTQMSGEKLRGNALTDDIIAKASYALQLHSHDRSAKIFQLIGETKALMS
jgi:hypothetical protein